jgi:short-subunit dehydrogenase
MDGLVDYTNENLKVFKLDLYDDKNIEECSREVISYGKNIDIYVNNAGVLLDEDETSIVIDKLRKTLQVNLIGSIDLTQKLLSIINKGGHIVNISSSAGSMENVHHADYPAYKISKAGVNMFTSWLAYKLKGEITVSSVHPGRVKTDMGDWEGDMDIEEAVLHIYGTAIKEDLETGQFWFKGEKFPW